MVCWLANAFLLIGSVFDTPASFLTWHSAALLHQDPRVRKRKCAHLLLLVRSRRSPWIALQEVHGSAAALDRALVDLKKDLDVVFKKIAVLKTKVAQQNPEAFQGSLDIA